MSFTEPEISKTLEGACIDCRAAEQIYQSQPEPLTTDVEDYLVENPCNFVKAGHCAVDEFIRERAINQELTTHNKEI